MYSWTACIIAFIVLWHVTATLQSIYVHRCIAHQYLKCHRALEEVFLFILWFTMGFGKPSWRKWYCAVHRRHHLYSDTEMDPHSPYHFTFKQLCWQQLVTAPSNAGAKNITSQAEADEFEHMNYQTWCERNIFHKYPKLGQSIFWTLTTILFGFSGFIMGGFFYFFGTEMVDFVGKYALHKIGYEIPHKSPTDRSKISFPITLFFGGEDLHAHHHNDTTKPWFDRNWYEIDLGWWYCRLFMFFGLMKRIK